MALAPRRTNNNIFAPRSPLDIFLSSPVKFATYHLYHYLAATNPPPPPPRDEFPVTVVCIADTHGRTPEIPPGDILIHAGDLTNNGTLREVRDQMQWLESLPHKHKYVIAGNHDTFLDPRSRRTLPRQVWSESLNLRTVHLLLNHTVQCTVHRNRRGRGYSIRHISIYASPYVPVCGGTNFAFQYRRNEDVWFNKIPRNVDILVTHTPPRFYRDEAPGMVHIGCRWLLDATWRSKPTLHVFGHVHSAHGRTVVEWDRGRQAYERACMGRGQGLLELLNPFAWFDLLWVLLFGLLAWRTHDVAGAGIKRKKSILVNAALWYDESGNLDCPIQVVVI